jgi:hemolysin III
LPRERSTPASHRDPAEEETATPILRGVSHAVAFWFALTAALLLVIVAPSPARAPALIYGIALCALFATSALYHRWRWDRRWRPLLRRLDHSTIFAFIAATWTHSRCSCSPAPHA